MRQSHVNNEKDKPEQPRNKKVHSLPRLKSLNQQPIKGGQIHKTKWSIAPKCLISGHQGQDIIYICINRQCNQATRLVCECCFFSEHSKHNENMLAMDEVKKGEIQRLRYWPFDYKFRRIFQFINKNEGYVGNMVQDINATFNRMAVRILNKIDRIRLDLLKSIDSFYVRETNKQHFQDKVKKDLSECFQLKKISEIVRQLFSKEIRHEVFIVKINQILNNLETQRNKQGLLNYFQAAQKGSDIFFDKLHFLKKQNWIIEQIEEQSKALKPQLVTIDETEVGIQKIVVQTIDYLNKKAEGMYPLQFDNKILEDGSNYSGFLSKGNKVLFGMRQYKNGFIYYGQWNNNARNGWGIYQNKDTGYKYAGEWKQDRKNGFGRQSSLVSVYQGSFEKDKKHGFGVLIQQGNRWQIEWKGDKKHGKGKLIDKSGMQTEIYYINGVESQSKSNKASPTFDLAELTKKFGSIKSTSG